MKKFLGALAALSMLAVATPAFAATISNPLFSNGQTSIDATGGATVSGTFTLTVGPGEVVEWLRTQSDPSQPFVDTSVGGQLGYQEQVYTNVPFSVKVPPNTGTFNPTVQGSGIFGGARAINGGDSVVLGATNLGSVRVVANASTVGTSSDVPVWQAAIDALTAQIAAIAKLIVPGSGNTTPAPSSMCAEFNGDVSGLYQGSTGDGVAKLQAFLLSKNPNAIPLIRSGAATYGYFGPQTAGAVATFRSGNGC